MPRQPDLLRTTSRRTADMWPSTATAWGRDRRLR